VPAILDYLGQSAELTAGTLRAIPQAVMGDGAGHVAVLTQVSATRPDGRSFDDRQIVLVTVEGGRVRSIEQFVGDPPAVARFWA
jgi:ketosteroid isomerase-like protein